LSGLSPSTRAACLRDLKSAMVGTNRIPSSDDRLGFGVL
jgi:hypothetical protein